MVTKGHQVEVAVIPNCDLCATQRKTSKAYADARLPGLGWANVCKQHFDSYGCRTGAGSGQEFVKREGN